MEKEYKRVYFKNYSFKKVTDVNVENLRNTE